MKLPSLGLLLLLALPQPAWAKYPLLRQDVWNAGANPGDLILKANGYLNARNCMQGLVRCDRPRPGDKDDVKLTARLEQARLRFNADAEAVFRAAVAGKRIHEAAGAALLYRRVNDLPEISLEAALEQQEDELTRYLAAYTLSHVGVARVRFSDGETFLFLGIAGLARLTVADPAGLPDLVARHGGVLAEVEVIGFRPKDSSGLAGALARVQSLDEQLAAVEARAHCTGGGPVQQESVTYREERDIDDQLRDVLVTRRYSETTTVQQDLECNLSRADKAERDALLERRVDAMSEVYRGRAAAETDILTFRATAAGLEEPVVREVALGREGAGTRELLVGAIGGVDSTFPWVGNRDPFPDRWEYQWSDADLVWQGYFQVGKIPQWGSFLARPLDSALRIGASPRVLPVGATAGG